MAPIFSILIGREGYNEWARLPTVISRRFPRDNLGVLERIICYVIQEGNVCFKSFILDYMKSYAGVLIMLRGSSG